MMYEVNGIIIYQVSVSIFVKADTEDEADEKWEHLFNEFSKHLNLVTPYGIDTDVEIIEEDCRAIIKEIIEM